MYNALKLKHYNKAASEGSPDRIMDALEIEPGFFIGDIGSGGGYYTLRFAEKVGDSGTVYAVDIDKNNLKYVGKKALMGKLGDRIMLTLATGESSNLPERTIDLLFSRNSFHHLKNRVEYFKNLKRCLKNGGKIAIIDHKKGHRSGPGINHGTGEGEIEKVMQEAGFIKYRSFDYLPGQWFYIYENVE